MNPRRAVRPTRQRGGATLIVALVLALLLLLTAGFTHHGLLFEHRTSVNQQRASQAFEAGEAGLAWVLAQMNRADRLDDHCLPVAAAAAMSSFRERYLAQAAAGRPLEAACMLADAGWACHCPAEGPATWPTDDERVNGFWVQVRAGGAAGADVIDVVARGCVGSPACSADADEGARPDAVATSRFTLARLPGLGTTPAAALTARGEADLSASAFELRHTGTDHSDAITAHTGGALQLGITTLRSVGGAPVLASVADQDEALAAQDADGLFASLFRMSRSAWQQQPAARTVRCASACDEALTQALGPEASNPMVWLAGGLRLDRATTLGSATRPVLLVVDGPVALQAPMVIHGVIYTTSPAWADAPGARVHGAVIAENDFRPTGSTRIEHDAGVLARLQTQTGTYAPVPGSWRDF